MKNEFAASCLLISLLAAALLPASSLRADTAKELEKAICHVCRVHEGESEAEKVAATADYEGTTYGFCSVTCRDKFLEEPVAYLPQQLPRPAPPFTALDLEGETFSSTALEGDWVLLDFWATWCPPCVADLPELTELHERYAEKGFAVVSVSIDEGDDAGEKVAEMIEKRKARHPVYLDAAHLETEADPAWSTYAVRVVPTQFLIDPEGQIVAQWSGKIDLDEVEERIEKALGGG